MQPFLTLKPSFFQANYIGVILTCFVLLPPIFDLEFYRFFSMNFILTFVLPIWIIQIIINISLNSFLFYDDKVVIQPYLTLIMDEKVITLCDNDKVILEYANFKGMNWIIYVENPTGNNKSKPIKKNASGVINARNIKQVAIALESRYGEKFEFRGKHLLRKELIG